MQQFLVTLIGMFLSITLYGQNNYSELRNPIKTDTAQWKNVHRPTCTWVNTDLRIKKETPLALKTTYTNQSLKAWKGERLSAQFAISTSDSLPKLHFKTLPLIGNKDTLYDCIQTAFVRYVMTDELNKDKQGTCGYRTPKDYDSTLVADVIDPITPELSMSPYSSQGGWITIKLPRTAQSNKYKTSIAVFSGEKQIKTLTLSIDVTSRTIDEPRNWKFHLDLWQNPYAVSRYYNVPPFSEAHFERLRPHMQLYADAGGNVVTASIMHKPWNGQTYDAFESMVTWLKKADGTWYYDFTAFDKWVEFMFSLGIDKQINCFSMVPWRFSFQYIDQASNTFKYLTAKPGEKEYESFWIPMLQAFAKHLKEKGWFEKTYIAMDERPLKDMLSTINVIEKADKAFKIALAGSYHKELVERLDDYCISIDEHFEPAEIVKRQAEGKITTYYTSCTQSFPNTYTFSNPAECEWLGWYVAHENLDGFLRWALNSWVKSPLQDSRFISWGAGDTYLIYPDGRSSIRFERLIEGIQAHEKIKQLQKEWETTNQQGKLKQLNKMLENFEPGLLNDTPADIIVRKAKAFLNKQ